MAKKRKRSEDGPVAPAPESTGQIRHKTLSAYYPYLYSLLTFLAVTLGYPEDDLVKEDDGETYKSMLLSSIVASRLPAVPKSGPAEPPRVLTRQPETIDRILHALSSGNGSGNSTRKRNNCLTLGYLSRDRTRATNRNRPAVEHQMLNSSVAELRTWEWRILHGRIGTQQFINLLVENAIYLATGPEKNCCFTQLCGTPLCNIPLICDTPPALERPGLANVVSTAPQRRRVSPINILLPRNRLFYAQSILQDGRKAFKYGLPRNHVLNLLISRRDSQPTDRDCRVLLKHVFPAQFRLRNVFVNQPAPGIGKHQAAPPINSMNRKRELSCKYLEQEQTTVPKRLRGEALGLMREMIVRFRRARVDRIAGIYLQQELAPSSEQEMRESQLDPDSSFVPSQLPPVDTSFEVPSVHLSQIGQEHNKPAFLMPVIPHGQVHRFLVHALNEVLPPRLLGSGPNFAVLAKHTLRFICAKQHDALSLHEMMQGLRVGDCSWLALGDSRQRVPQAENLKRCEILQELIYWIFDALVIPLLRTACYVTETAVTKYATVYFRRSVWDKVSRPHLEDLAQNLLEEIPTDEIRAAREGVLGVSRVRLVPKASGFRPVVNLGRRRPCKLGGNDDDTVITSANEELTGVYRVLTYHKVQRREQLQATLFGTNEIFPRLQAFKRSMLKPDGSLPRLYFVKMDIRAAFDTIDQDMMMNVLRGILQGDHDYSISSYAQILPPSGQALRSNATKLFKQRARTTNDTATFKAYSASSASALRNAVFVDLVRYLLETTQGCLELLATHVQANMVQIDQKVFRQKRGIPQGSKVSSMLCSLLYAHLEQTELQWTRNPGSVLLRYIDDYLYITDSFELARRFVKRMNHGFPRYGAFIAPDKTLVSFDGLDEGIDAKICEYDSQRRRFFPYCGYGIDIDTLEIRMDHTRIAASNIGDSFSIRFAKERGRAFLGWFSRQLENRNHVAYLDLCHNSPTSVHCNVILNFLVTGMKIPHYLRSWGTLSEQQASSIYDALLIAVVYTHTAGRARVIHAVTSGSGSKTVPKRTFQFLALSALHRTLSQKASKFRLVLLMLTAELSTKRYRGFQNQHQAELNHAWDLVKNTQF